MTARRSRRTILPSVPHRSGTLTLRAVLVLALCVALVTACSVLPGRDGAGAPITVMTWAPDQTDATNEPGMPALAQAYARWANDHGGVGGHHLTVLTCNEHNDSAGAEACARRAVEAKVVAVVGSYSQYSRSFLAMLAAAGIPYIGGYGLTDEEFTSPVSYPVNGGQPALMVGNGRQLALACSRIALVRPDTIAGESLPRLLDAGLKAARHDPAVDIRAAEDADAYTAQADEALARAAGVARRGKNGKNGGDGGVDQGAGDESGEGCVLAVLGDRNDQFFDSFRRVRDRYPEVGVSSVLGSVDQSTLDRSGGARSMLEGAYVTGWYPAISDPGWDEMRAMLRRYASGDHRIDPADAGVQTTWIAYTVLRKAVEALGNEHVTGNALRHAFDNGLEVDTGGLTPPLSWRFQDLMAAADFPRLVNADVTFQVVRRGRLVAQRRGFVNVSDTLENADQ